MKIAIMTTRTCSKCGENKPETTEYFHPKKHCINGLVRQCRICVNTRTREWRKDNPKQADRHKKEYWNNREKHLKRGRDWRKNNKEAYKSTVIKSKYGVTLEEYNEMLGGQNYKCAICGSDNSGRGDEAFCIDHNHKTGKIRGLLCHNCNIGLSKFKENISNLEKSIKYLENYNG